VPEAARHQIGREHKSKPIIRLPTRNSDYVSHLEYARMFLGKGRRPVTKRISTSRGAAAGDYNVMETFVSVLEDRLALLKKIVT